MTDRDASFVVYIDESGDEGFVFPASPEERGSSQWFVLSAVVFHAETEPKDVKCVDAARLKLKRPANKPLHFRDLDHKFKVVYAQHVAQAHMQIVNVLFYKPELGARIIFRKKGVLYHYATRFLLERVSWLCRDRFMDSSQPRVSGTGKARLIFSHRRTMSYDDLRGYLKTLQKDPDTTIDWDVIDPEMVESHPHAAFRGLQIADVAASAFWKAVEPDEFGNAEDRYARVLLHRVYVGERGPLGHGIKIYPSTALAPFQNSNRLLEP